MSLNLFDLTRADRQSRESSDYGSAGNGPRNRESRTGTLWRTAKVDEPSPEKDELEQAIQSIISYLNNLPMLKPSSPILTEATTQQWLHKCHKIRLLVSVLKEQSTVRGLKNAFDNGARMWNSEMKSQDMGDATAGVKEFLLVLGKLRESTSGVADSSTASILETKAQLGTVPRAIGGEWHTRRQTGSGQRVWTKRWRALRHSALDTVDKLMARGLGKNVDDRGPCEPGMLAGVDGRVGLREREQEIFCSCSIHEQARRQSEENWEQRWRSVETCTHTPCRTHIFF